MEYNVLKMVFRKKWLLVRLAIFLAFFLIIWNIYRSHVTTWFSLSESVALTATPTSKITHMTADTHIVDLLRRPMRDHVIIIAAVACETRVEEAVIMMKSALLLSPSFISLEFILFSDDDGAEAIKKTVQSWPKKVSNRMILNLHPITFPSDNKDDWKKLFKPCASQRLFLPVSITNNVDSNSNWLIISMKSISEPFGKCRFTVVC